MVFPVYSTGTGQGAFASLAAHKRSSWRSKRCGTQNMGRLIGHWWCIIDLSILGGFNPHVRNKNESKRFIYPRDPLWKLKNKSFETTGRWKNSCTTFYLVTCGLLKPCEKWGDILKYQLVVWDSFHHHQQYRQVFADWNLPRLIRELHITTRWSVVWEDLFGFLAEKNQKNEAKAQKKVLKQRW